MDQKANEMWAVIELMGHAQTAGIIKASDFGGLIRVDVPMDDGFRTEFYGSNAIYAIRVVSEEIARAYAMPDREICSYDVPIVPRAQYEEALSKSRRQIETLAHQVDVLQKRLTSVNSLPEPDDGGREYFEDETGGGMISDPIPIDWHPPLVKGVTDADREVRIQIEERPEGARGNDNPVSL